MYLNVFCTLLQSHVRTNYVDRTEVEHVKAELEAKSRLELNRKLEEVNSYLEEQAQARERLDKLRDSNEFEMRREFDKTKKDLMVRAIPCEQVRDGV